VAAGRFRQRALPLARHTMKALPLAVPGQHLTLLCLGAHSDDIEIGVGGTVLSWLAQGVKLDVCWQVLSAPGARGIEARRAAEACLVGARTYDIGTQEFQDGTFPEQGAAIKAWMETLKGTCTPDIIFTHRRDDAHQDHRTVSLTTWSTFRDHLILEYEIPKWDGDLGQPNLYMPFDEAVLDRKMEILLGLFATQREKDWFDGETFRGLARLRGVECRSPGLYAEGFVLRKARLG
jgi:LmbE family N-acetylglucosaminyl deacetylase